MKAAFARASTVAKATVYRSAGQGLVLAVALIWIASLIGLSAPFDSYVSVSSVVFAQGGQLPAGAGDPLPGITPREFEDFRLGLNAAQTTGGAIALLTGARIK